MENVLRLLNVPWKSWTNICFFTGTSGARAILTRFSKPHYIQKMRFLVWNVRKAASSIIIFLKLEGSQRLMVNDYIFQNFDNIHPDEFWFQQDKGTAHTPDD